jgi:hypothetical protein
MKTHLPNAAAVVAAAAMMLGAISCTNESALRVEAKVARDSYATQEDPSSLEPVSWMYPQQVGADAPALESKYYISLKVTPGNALDPGLITIVTSDSGMALRIVTVLEGSPGGQQTVYHIDTDGYTQHLLLQQPKDKRLKIYFALGPKGGKSNHMFAAELPERSQLRNGPQDLKLQPVENIPEVEGRDPIKVQEWPSLPDVGLHAPAVGRKQANETSLYFCYKSPGGTARTP